MQTVANPWLWAGFVALVLVLLALDLGIFHREDRPVPAREALSWVVVWAIVDIGLHRLTSHLYLGVLTRLALDCPRIVQSHQSR